MKPIADFVKTTFVGGLLFLVPAVLIVLLVKQAVEFARKILTPIEKLFPVEKIGGVAVEHVLAILLILAVCFLAGLAVRTSPGAKLNAWLERVILRRVPGFGMVKRAAKEMANIESQSDFSVALARIEDAWVLSFIVEKLDSGLLAVFVPSVPTPAVGSIYYLTEDRVRRLDVPVSSAISCIMRLGVGSKELLQGCPNLEAASEEPRSHRNADLL
jgi:uncharacterized membrane protein